MRGSDYGDFTKTLIEHFSFLFFIYALSGIVIRLCL